MGTAAAAVAVLSDEYFSVRELEGKSVSLAQLLVQSGRPHAMMMGPNGSELQGTVLYRHGPVLQPLLKEARLFVSCRALPRRSTVELCTASDLQSAQQHVLGKHH